jgi:hypothetical protein
MLIDTFTVDSPSVSYEEEHITSSYEYDTSDLVCGVDGKYTVRPKTQNVQFQTTRRVPKVGYANDCAVQIRIFLRLIYMGSWEGSCLAVLLRSCQLHTHLLDTCLQAARAPPPGLWFSIST